MPSRTQRALSGIAIGRVFPSEQVFHFRTYGLPPDDEAACRRQGWDFISEARRRKVVDVVIFSIELDLLRLRLEELWESVDEFVIMESRRTFMGEVKVMDWLAEIKNWSHCTHY